MLGSKLFDIPSYEDGKLLFESKLPTKLMLPENDILYTTVLLVLWATETNPMRKRKYQKSAGKLGTIIYLMSLFDWIKMPVRLKVMF